jgi:hypothetical protein
MQHGSATMLLLVALFLPSCSIDDPGATPNDPQEVITTVTLILQDTAASGPVNRVVFRDIDGPGGNLPEVDTVKLIQNMSYSGTILLLNEARTPPDTISNEVAAEKNSHQFFYTPEGTLAGRITIQKTDSDTNSPPLPVGLEFILRVNAGGAVSGFLRVVLSHYAGTPKTLAPSSDTDVDVRFPVTVE